MKAMLAVFFGLLAVGALVAGTAFVLSKALPRMPNKASRFVLFFVVCVPLGFGYDYVKHWALGYHPSAMSWPVALIVALLWATLCTFWGPQSHNSNTQ
jgi:hypothetical protein